MSLRKQAQEATDVLDEGEAWWLAEVLKNAANVAGDVWEPIVKELIAIAKTPIRSVTLLDRVQEIEEML